MSESIHSTGITKRDFIRCCALGVGGLMVGVNRLSSFTCPLEHASFDPNSDELWKWSKEALFYEKTAEGVQCHKCPHGCFLANGDAGICRNRINYNGTMYSIAYGNPCAVHIDPVEKKPLFHFLPSTKAYSIAAAGCNLRCLNCQNWQISQFSPKETQNYDLMPPQVVEECLKSGSESIAYTYGEPTTFYEYAFDTATLAHEKKIKNIWKSSGYINEEPLRKICTVIDAANIDLKGFDQDMYQKLNGVNLLPVLNTLKTIKKEGVWLEITNLIIPGWSDNLSVLKKMYEWLVANGLAACPVHITRFMPLYKLTYVPTTPVATLEKAHELAVNAGIHYAYIGNVPGHTCENTFCFNCKKMVIERRGFQILQNNIIKSACKFCGEIIPGVWV